MKKNTFQFVGIFILGLMACLSQSCKQAPADGKESIVAIDKDLKDKFGDKAFYTNIAIVNDKSVGSIISLAVSEKQASKELIEYTCMKGAWEKKGTVTLDIEGDAGPELFMFDLVKDASLAKVAELVELSKKKLADEKQLADAVVKTIGLNAPENGNKAEMLYAITLEPKNGGTAFNFVYDLQGKLVTFTF